jgi:hypothetical protein
VQDACVMSATSSTKLTEGILELPNTKALVGVEARADRVASDIGAVSDVNATTLIFTPWALMSVAVSMAN